jgi:hypothetical protein
VTNLALSGLITRADDSPLRTCAAHCPPRFALRGYPSIFPIHSILKFSTVQNGQLKE